jgi:hypothetical protein
VEVLAQREALEVLHGQDARLEARVVGELDAEHVPGLALVPVGTAVHPGDRRAGRLLAPSGAARAQADAVAGGGRVQHRHDVEALLAGVDAEQAVEEVVGQDTLVAADLGDLGEGLVGHLDRERRVLGAGAHDRVTEPLAQQLLGLLGGERVVPACQHLTHASPSPVIGSS